MSKWFVLLLLTVALLFPNEVHAVGLQVTPNEYKVTLKRDEKKKGFIDVHNPLGEEVSVKTSVQAFEQTDNEGSLRFYDDKDIQAGVLLDLARFKIGPGETMRMYFMVDGSKLPSGDVFGAIFFTTEPTKVGGVVQSVRLGTLLSVTNGEPSGRKAEITALKTSFWQLGQGIQGSYSVRNMAEDGQKTGFYPTVSISLNPFSLTQKHDSTLVFAGRERSNDFRLDTGSRFGLYVLKASYEDSVREELVFVATGYWKYIGGALLLSIIGAGVYLIRRWRKKRLRMSFSTSSR